MYINPIDMDMIRRKTQEMRHRGLWLSLIALLAMPWNSLWAQQPAQNPADERQALEQEVQDLRKRLDALEQKLKAQADAASAAASVTTVAAIPATTGPASAPSAENTTPAVGGSPKGFIIQSA